MFKGFHSNRESGMSLVSVLISLGIMGISAVAATSWHGQYQIGRAKLNATASIGEVERALIASVSDSLREYTRRGCTPAAQNRLITARRVADHDEVNKRGRIQLVTNANKFTIPPQFKDQSSQPAKCPMVIGGPKMETCFRYEPAKPAKKGKSILDADLVFVTVQSDIIDLRTGTNINLATGTGLTCANLSDTPGMRKCSKLIADANRSTQLCQPGFFESSYPGGGMKHQYSIYWQIGPSGKANFNRKDGVVYVAN